MIELRRQRAPRGIDLTPLIDVVFQLLVFFLLTASYTLPALPLRLPEANEATAAEPAAIVLTITDDGRVLIGETALPEAKLDLVIAQRVALVPRAKIQIRGDIDARYGLFVRVLDACRAAGADEVALETRAR